MIQVSGIVITGAGIVSRHRLHRTAKSQRPDSGMFHTPPSIGENKAKIYTAPEGLLGAGLQRTPGLACDGDLGHTQEPQGQ
jgi:hypothetical protein